MAMALSSIIASTILLAINCRAMAGISPDPRDFFGGKIGSNLTKITWAHAVNSKSELRSAMANDTIMMLEADISLGTITGGSKDIIPIMAHPPNATSDLSLKDFLNATLESRTRGIKLDFKTIEAFNASLPILKANREKITVPLFLNADILKGPHAKDDKPVDAVEFLKGAKEFFPESKLSLGWKTKDGNVATKDTANYTQQQIQEMIDVISKNNVTQSITYAVRAAHAIGDIASMQHLLNRTSLNNSTLTIWSSAGDSVDVDKLKKLIATVGIEKCYVDVPAETWNQTKPSTAGAPSAVPAMTLLLGALMSSFSLSHLV